MSISPGEWGWRSYLGVLLPLAVLLPVIVFGCSDKLHSGWTARRRFGHIAGFVLINASVVLLAFIVVLGLALGTAGMGP